MYYSLIGNNKLTRIRNWQKLPDSCPIRDPGKYYIFLHDAYDDEYSQDPFNLSFNFIPEFDHYEPNDNLPNAKLIELNEEIEFAIFPTLDRDFFEVKNISKDKIQIKQISEPNIELEIRLHKGNNKISDWGKLPATFDVKQYNEIKFELRSYDDRKSMRELQKITIIEK